MLRIHPLFHESVDIFTSHSWYTFQKLQIENQAHHDEYKWTAMNQQKQIKKFTLFSR